jgi:hypothetical protein
MAFHYCFKKLLLAYRRCTSHCYKIYKCIPTDVITALCEPWLNLFICLTWVGISVYFFRKLSSNFLQFSKRYLTKGIDVLDHCSVQILCLYPVKSVSTICSRSGGNCKSCKTMAPERLKSLLEIPYNTKNFLLTLQNVVIRAKFVACFDMCQEVIGKHAWLACAVSLRTFNLKLFLYRCLKVITRGTFCSSDGTERTAWLRFELKRKQ